MKKRIKSIEITLLFLGCVSLYSTDHLIGGTVVGVIFLSFLLHSNKK